MINHCSEVFAYFFSSTFISQLGHVKVLCIGLGCNVLRFLYISLLKNPWWVLPFEFVQGTCSVKAWHDRPFADHACSNSGVFV